MNELVEQHPDSDQRAAQVREAARARSEEADVPVVSAATGRMLQLFARLLAARHVVEVGTGGGYSGLWLLAGMDPRGSLTTIEAAPERQALAQHTFADARLSDRVRSMLGPALTVLPRLADANYDLVFLDGDRSEYGEYLVHAKRLLRPGGLLLAAGAEEAGDFLTAVEDDPELLAVQLPHPLDAPDAGLLAAVHGSATPLSAAGSPGAATRKGLR